MIYDEQIFNQLLAVLNILVIPLFIWIWRTDRKNLTLETELKILKESHQTLIHNTDEILKSVSALKDDLHDSYVSQKSCDFRHKIH